VASIGPTRRRGPLTAGIAAISLVLLLAQGRTLFAHPRYSERTGLSCTACHVGSDGGELTELGRSRRLEMLLSDIGDGGHAASASGASGAGRGTAPPPWGILSGEASLYWNGGRQPVYGSTSQQLSLTESLRLNADRIGGHDELSFHGEGMTRSTFSDGPTGYDGNAARLTTAELDWNPGGGGTSWRLGRHFVAAGVAVRQLDGVSIHEAPTDSVELDAFGGVPTDNGFGGASGDLFVGGRAGLVMDHAFRAGISSFYAKDAADPSDLRVGLDLELSPVKQVDLLGHLFYDWISDRLYDGRVHLVWKPSIAWQYAADYSYTIPGLFFPKDSIFSVFSVDTVEEVAATATRLFDERRSLRVFVRQDWYEGGDSALQLGAGSDVRYGPNGEDSLDVELYWQAEERAGLGGDSIDGDVLFTRIAHLLYWTAAVYTAEEVDWDLYPGNAVAHDARLLRLLVGWRPDVKWELQIGAEEVRDPQTDRRLGIFGQVTWRF
jgi:hypothetical protein